MNKTWKLWLALLAVFSLVAAACGDDDDDPAAAGDDAAEAADADADDDGDDMADDGDDMADDGDDMADDGDDMAEEPAEIRVAIVAPSAENDLAFTQSIVDGTDALEGVSDIAITPGTFQVEVAATAIRDYAEEGYDLVIGHGSQYGGSIEEIAKDYPDTAFAWGTAVDTFGLPNVSAYTAAANEGGYVLGTMAATQSSSIGVIGPINVGDAALYVDGFRLGAEAGGADVSVVFTESFSDVQLASETATAMANQGAEVLTGTAQMTVGAIGVAADEGLSWYGTQSNQAPAAASGVVVASQVYKWEVALQQLVDDIRAGGLGGSSYEINLENGGLVIEFGDDVSDNLKATAADTIAAVIAGDVVTTVS